MSSRPRWIIATIAAGLIGVAPARSAVAQADADEARARLIALYTAIERGDSTALRSQLNSELRWIINIGGVIDEHQLISAVGMPTPARFTVDSVHATHAGETLIADYIRRDRWPLGDSSFTTTWRAVAVFTRASDRWQLVRHSLTWLAQPVPAIALDSAALQPFVGRYQIAPNYIDDVHWEGDHLVATASGQMSGARLVPVSTTAFSPDGIGSVLGFERDAQGRVLGYVQAYPDGRVVRARRLP